MSISDSRKWRSNSSLAGIGARSKHKHLFLDYIVVPKSADDGLHDLRVVITDYDGELNEEVITTFTVLKGANQVTTYFFILLGTILIGRSACNGTDSFFESARGKYCVQHNNVLILVTVECNFMILSCVTFVTF